MKYLLLLPSFVRSGRPRRRSEPPRPIVSGHDEPRVRRRSRPDGKVYVSVIGEFDKPGDGAVVRIEDGKVVPFANGLDDPKGLVAFQQWLFVADRDKVVRGSTPRAKTEVIAGPDAFPTPAEVPQRPGRRPRERERPDLVRQRLRRPEGRRRGRLPHHAAEPEGEECADTDAEGHRHSSRTRRRSPGCTRRTGWPSTVGIISSSPTSAPATCTACG